MNPRIGRRRKNIQHTQTLVSPSGVPVRDLYDLLVAARPNLPLSRLIPESAPLFCFFEPHQHTACCWRLRESAPQGRTPNVGRNFNIGQPRHGCMTAKRMPGSKPPSLVCLSRTARQAGSCRSRRYSAIYVLNVIFFTRRRSLLGRGGAFSAQVEARRVLAQHAIDTWDAANRASLSRHAEADHGMASGLFAWRVLTYIQHGAG